jgi:aspartate carbamoyltransferase regulatory subunit
MEKMYYTRKMEKSDNKGEPKKELKIGAIYEGAVIDHIPIEYTFKVAEILNITSMKNVVSIASNLDSKKLGKKGLIKIGGPGIDERDVQKIALIAPNATLSVIKNYKVVQKTSLKIPNDLRDIVRCFNPNCITNKEPVETIFKVESKSPLRIRCHYCERAMQKDEIRVL